MKRIVVSLYIFFCTGGTYAQTRQNNVVAELDFNTLPAWLKQVAADTTKPLHIEAEKYTDRSGAVVIPCSEGGLCLAFIKDMDYSEYQVSIPSDGIYKLSVRIAGSGKDVWVADSTWNILGKIRFDPTASDQTYSTASTRLFLKAGNRKIRLQSRGAKYSLNWLEIEPTGLYRVCDFESDWEQSILGILPWKASRADSTSGWIKQTARPGSLQIDNQRCRTGKSAARFELRKSDSAIWPNVRSEIYMGPCPYQEMWFGFSTNSPTNVLGDPLAHIFFQLHGTDDPCDAARSPVMDLRVEADTFRSVILWDADACNNNDTKDGQVSYNLGQFKADTWDDWVIHIRFAFDKTGVLEMWRNGIKVIDRQNAPNCYNDKIRPYPKFGIYKWGWTPEWAKYSPYDTLVVYIDNVRIGGPKSNYGEVMP